MLLNTTAQLDARSTGSSRVVVIGSGATGLYAARELARLGRDVVVVESGGVGLANFELESYSSVGWKHDGIRIGRSRSLGGTTNLWGGQLVEFQPIDFKGRDWIPGSSWPVQYEEIQPFYRRTYENLGIEGEAQDDLRVFDELLGSRPSFEEGVELFLTRWLKIPSFAVAYAKEIRSSENLRAILNHTAVGFRGSNGVITGVRVVDSNGNTHTIEGSQFILAAGTIEISRLLLHAAAAPDWPCPWRHNPNVGSHFQDHLGGPVASVYPHNHRLFFDTFSTMVWSGHKYQPKLRLTNETLEGLRILNIQGMFSFDSSIGENLVYLRQFLKAAIYSRKVSSVRDLLSNLAACWKYLVPLMWRYIVDKRIFVPSTSKISLVIQGEQMPVPESRIAIDATKYDANRLPRAILDWRPGEEVLSSIKEFVLRTDRALRGARLAELRAREDLMSLDPRFLRTLRDTNHTTGGARMSSAEQDGVVDRNLRVFGTTNLYVAGAATFRTTSNANTTFTALAFVTRLIDHLASENGAR